MEGFMDITQSIPQRKQRITKKQSQEFTRWYESNPNVHELSISNIINQYYELTNVKVSRMYVSNIRRMINQNRNEE